MSELDEEGSWWAFFVFVLVLFVVWISTVIQDWPRRDAPVIDLADDENKGDC